MNFFMKPESYYPFCRFFEISHIPEVNRSILFHIYQLNWKALISIKKGLIIERSDSINDDRILFIIKVKILST